MNLPLTRLRIASSSLVVLLSAFSLSCRTSPLDNTELAGPEAVVLDPVLAAATWVLDVDLKAGAIGVTPPLLSPDRTLSGRDLEGYLGLGPGQPQASILGEDVVDVILVPGSLEFGPMNAASLRRRVAMEVQVVNRLRSVMFSAPTIFPIAPDGITSPVLFPLQNVATVTQGGVSVSGNEIVVEMPSEGNVVASDSIWQGPPHDFFFNEPCSAGAPHCFLFMPLVEEQTQSDTIHPASSSLPVRLGWDVELGVSQFRTRLVLAADLMNPPT